MNHCKANTNAGCRLRQGRYEQQRIIVDAFTGEIVFGQPDIAEAQRLGTADLLDLLIDA